MLRVDLRTMACSCVGLACPGQMSASKFIKAAWTLGRLDKTDGSGERSASKQMYARPPPGVPEALLWWEDPYELTRDPEIQEDEAATRDGGNSSRPFEEAFESGGDPAAAARNNLDAG